MLQKWENFQQRRKYVLVKVFSSDYESKNTITNTIDRVQQELQKFYINLKNDLERNDLATAFEIVIGSADVFLDEVETIVLHIENQKKYRYNLNPNKKELKEAELREKEIKKKIEQLSRQVYRFRDIEGDIRWLFKTKVDEKIESILGDKNEKVKIELIVHKISRWRKLNFEKYKKSARDAIDLGRVDKVLENVINAKIFIQEDLLNTKLKTDKDWVFLLKKNLITEAWRIAKIPSGVLGTGFVIFLFFSFISCGIKSWDVQAKENVFLYKEADDQSQECESIPKNWKLECITKSDSRCKTTCNKKGLWSKVYSSKGELCWIHMESTEWEESRIYKSAAEKMNEDCLIERWKQTFENNYEKAFDNEKKGRYEEAIKWAKVSLKIPCDAKKKEKIIELIRRSEDRNRAKQKIYRAYRAFDKNDKKEIVKKILDIDREDEEIRDALLLYLLEKRSNDYIESLLNAPFSKKDFEKVFEYEASGTAGIKTREEMSERATELKTPEVLSNINKRHSEIVYKRSKIEGYEKGLPKKVAVVFESRNRYTKYSYGIHYVEWCLRNNLEDYDLCYPLKESRRKN